MRGILIAAASLLLVGPALAQDWQEFRYPEFGFAVSFPGTPKVETATYTTTDGKTLPEHLYSLAQPGSIYRIAVVDYSTVAVSHDDAIAQAVNMLRKEGTVTVDIDARVDREYGRQLGITGKDGSHSVVALFYDNNNLYQIEGVTLASNPDPQSSNAGRFQQSLQFLGANFGGGRGGFGGPGGRGRGGNRPPPPPRND